MIECHDLRKNYGTAAALRGISFRVERGEVVGFLGPNGAGKSTTMRILTGYLRPTAGRAAVLGLDVVDDSLAVRRRIGYLPESTPLYDEMRVDEYLRFAAEIRGVARGAVRGAVDRVIDTCGLQRVIGKHVFELSKGFRQRLGLAQAMVHEPDLLILDEPTSGLDPNQIVEVRGLIERLREQHTVILSTHYLQEVEAVCSRVIIVDRGRIVADGSRDELVRQLPPGPVRVVADGVDVTALRAALGAGVRVDVATGEEAAPSVALSIHADDEVAVAAAVASCGGTLRELVRLRPSLEDAFRALTSGVAAASPEGAAPERATQEAASDA